MRLFGPLVHFVHLVIGIRGTIHEGVEDNEHWPRVSQIACDLLRVVTARYSDLDVIVYQKKAQSRTMTKRACKYGRKIWNSRSEDLVSRMATIRGR